MRNIIDLVINIFLYYKKVEFAKVDLTLLTGYFWKSPYRIAREEAKRRDLACLVPYGETPLRTMELIAKEAGITRKDVVYELGSGRGRAAFWLSFFVGCKVVGIEAIDLFVLKAKRVSDYFHVQNIDFRVDDLRYASFQDATVLYLFGSQLADSDIELFLTNLRRQKRLVKIITISYSLVEYAPRGECQLIKEFEVAFPWGRTTCYIQNFIGK